VEGSVSAHDPHGSRRRRRSRKPTLGDRLRLWFEMPRLKRSERNQRLAIAGVVLLMVMYFLVLRPLLDMMPSGPGRAATPAPTKAGPGLQKKR
jgi:hypothetical protein